MDIGKIAMRLLWAPISLLLGIVMLPAFHDVEFAMLPVVEDFTVTDIRHDAGDSIIRGHMNKRRECRFVGLNFYAGDASDATQLRERLTVIFGEPSSDANESRMEGAQPWGPWRLKPPVLATGPDVFMTVTHSCHPLYNLTGIYFKSPFSDIFP